MDLNLLLGEPIKVDLKKGTYTPEFEGLFLENYLLKDFLKPGIGYDRYMTWCQSIVITPKDIADVLWVEHNVYYKEISDWEFLLSRCYDLNTGEAIQGSPVLEGLKYFFGYEFYLSFDKTKKTTEEALYFSLLSEKGEWVAKIDKNNFERIRSLITKVNHIQPSELSTWNYAFEKQEKRALRYYYDKRNNPIKPKLDYEFSLETILRFLKVESGLNYKDLFNESLYEINKCYEMKTSTLRTFALNVGIYGGNLKIDSNIRRSLIYGVAHKAEKSNDIISGNNRDSIGLENK